MAFPRDDLTRHRENRDLMHVSGDDLFADPLNVRDKRQAAYDVGGIAQPGPLRASRGGESRRHERNGREDREFAAGHQGYHPDFDEDRGFPTKPMEKPLETTMAEWEDTMQETFGYVVSSMWSIVAGGRQCCSMRDRNRKEDLEAARRAALTGRPPKRHEELRPETPQAAREVQRAPRRHPAADDDDDEGEEPPYLNHELHGTLGPVPNSSLPDGGFRDDPFLSGRKLPEASFAPALDPPLLSRPERESPMEKDKGDPAPPEHELPSKWDWPPWCLNFKSPNIEVWVLDEDAGIGRWVSAQPQSRVVDKSGRDAYLCAEYLWDGEYYVQDFGPQHVRRKGEQRTVLETLTQDAELETTKVFKGDENLVDTKVFKDKKKPKKEGGLSSFLED